MSTLVDIGANLTHDTFDEDRQDVLQRARDAGVTQVIVTGTSIDGSEKALQLAREHDGLFATAGIHPHHADETSTEAMSRLEALSADERVKAIGETGLDFFRDYSPRKDQIASFEDHLALAIKTRLPLFLHERDAWPVFPEVLRSCRNELTDVVVHCFTGDQNALHAYLDLDCHIGITGWICDERRGAHLIPLIRDIPVNRLMIETDAPYLLPRSIRPKPKSRRNEPYYLTVVCKAVASARGETYDELARQTSANAVRFFDI